MGAVPAHVVRSGSRRGFLLANHDGAERPALAGLLRPRTRTADTADTTFPRTRRRHVSSILGSSRTNDPTFSQPIITYDETQLIIAEAAFQTNDKATATTALNNVRARYSKPPIASPTLTDIMTEKYILMFQNVERGTTTSVPASRRSSRRATSSRSRAVPVGTTETQTNTNAPGRPNRRSRPVATGMTRTAVRKWIGAGSELKCWR